VDEEFVETKRGGRAAGDDDDDDEMDYAAMMAEEKRPSLDESTASVNLSASYQRRKVDPVAWKAELERVGPKLRVSFAALGKEWRAHMHQTQQHEQVLSTLLPSSREQLLSISTSTASALGRVEQKEKFMNSQYSELGAQYRELQAKVRGATERFEASQSLVVDLTEELEGLDGKIDKVRTDHEVKGKEVTDTTPMMKLRESLKHLDAETRKMDLRMGIVGHTLLQSAMRAKTHARRKGGSKHDDNHSDDESGDDDDDSGDVDDDGEHSDDGQQW
jgi:estrogen-related receptor beta like 1